MSSLNDNRSIRKIVRFLSLSALATVAFSTGVQAEPASKGGANNTPPPVYAKWRGIWERAPGSFWGFDPSIKPPALQNAPYKPELMAQYLRAMDPKSEESKKTLKLSNCTPPAMPQIMNTVYQMELITSPDELIISSEDAAILRHVYMDKRGLIEKKPSFMGRSVAHWEGDTLVIKTDRLRADMPFEGFYHPGMTVTERMRLVSDNAFEAIVSVDSPNFSKPWTVTKRWVRAPAENEINEFVCSENDRNPLDEEGVTGFTVQN